MVRRIGDLWSLAGEMIVFFVVLGCFVGATIPIALLVEAGKLVEAIISWAALTVVALVLYPDA